MSYSKSVYDWAEAYSGKPFPCECDINKRMGIVLQVVDTSDSTARNVTVDNLFPDLVSIN